MSSKPRPAEVAGGKPHKKSISEEFRPIFYPDSIAVIGASEEPTKAGALCMRSLLEGGYKGRLYPVNPAKESIGGIRCYPSLLSIPDSVDLAVVAVPAPLLPGVLKEGARKGVKGMVVITAGFKETEEELGEKLQHEMATIANQSGIKLLGPNTAGMLNFSHNLNASFTPVLSTMKRGGVSLITQSGGIMHYFCYHALAEDVGLSKVIGVGNRCNLDFAALFRFLVEDPQTTVIAMYIEGTDKARELMTTARELRGRKPVLAYKVQGSSLLCQAAYSHTGSLSGQGELYHAAFKQSGIIPIPSVQGIVDAAKALSYCPPARGDRIAVLSFVAGPGMAAASACERIGLRLARFSPSTQDYLNQVVSPIGNKNNPIDLALTPPDKWERMAANILADEEVDALIFISAYTPLIAEGTNKLTKLVAELRHHTTKPILAAFSFPGDAFAREKALLQENNIPVYPSPERAAEGMKALVDYGAILNGTARPTRPG